MRYLALMLLLAQSAPQGSFVRVSPRDHRYLELSDGTPYVPIGLNMISPPRAGTDEESFRSFEDWLRQLSANGGNYIRVWLSSPFWDVEHERSGVYDPEQARKTDRLLALCARYGIRVKLTLEHLRGVGDSSQSWANKPLHNVANGGTARDMADFLDGEPSRDLFRKKIRWYAERYGSQPAVYGWELWNEINAVRGGDYLGWTRVMLRELHAAFPENLGMQSLGSFDGTASREPYRVHSTMPGNDLAQVHRYLDLGAQLEICRGPVDLLAADAVRELLGYAPARPVILAESGAVEPRHSGPFKLYAADRQGIILHDILFAPFFAGAAGPGQIWHWDEYVAKNDLWWHFSRFAEAIRGIDPPAENFQPIMIPDPRFRIYALKGESVALAWIRDAQATWMSELRDGQAPPKAAGTDLDLSAIFQDLKKVDVRTYDPWTGRSSKGKRHGSVVRLPEFTRSLVVRVTGAKRT